MYSLCCSFHTTLCIFSGHVLVMQVNAVYGAF